MPSVFAFQNWNVMKGAKSEKVKKPSSIVSQELPAIIEEADPINDTTIDINTDRQQDKGN